MRRVRTLTDAWSSSKSARENAWTAAVSVATVGIAAGACTFFSFPSRSLPDMIAQATRTKGERRSGKAVDPRRNSTVLASGFADNTQKRLA